MINTFIKKPHTLQSTANFRIDTESFDGDKIAANPTLMVQSKPDATDADAKIMSVNSDASSITKEKLLSRYFIFPLSNCIYVNNNINNNNFISQHMD